MNFLSTGNGSFQHEKIRRARESRARSKERERHDGYGKRSSNGTTETIEDLSNWAGMTSPSSSDFETISDSELATSLGGPSRRVPTFQPSNLGRTLSRAPLTESGPAAKEHEDTGDSGGNDMIAPLGHRRHASNSGSRDGEGDDEFSSVEDEDGRRGRTRKRREEDPGLKKSLLEDALRSSLATLLSLSVPPQTQSPAMSHTNLTALLGSHSPSGGISPGRPATQVLGFPPPRSSRPSSSPYVFSLDGDEASAGVEGAENEDSRLQQEREDAKQWEEDLSSTSEVELIEVASSENASDNEGTQLGPRTHHLPSVASQRPSRAIPILTSSRQDSRARSNSDSLPSTSTQFSPLQSRTLGLAPSSGSPPTWSRRRRRRGQRYASSSPGPATVDERRRARGITDAEDEGVEVDRVFLDLVDAAKVFIDMSPRRGRGSHASSTPGTPDSRSRPLSEMAPFMTDSQVRVKQQWTPDPASSPSPSLPSSDPQLASSVPDFSSLDEEDPMVASLRRIGSPKGSSEPDKPKPKGWWWGRTIEIKVWHLVGLAGLLLSVGAGLGAISFFKANKPPRLALYF